MTGARQPYRGASCGAAHRRLEFESVAVTVPPSESAPFSSAPSSSLCSPPPESDRVIVTSAIVAIVAATPCPAHARPSFLPRNLTLTTHDHT
ncbi:hypothetical protein BST61_g267 [Cercospora zeina]